MGISNMPMSVVTKIEVQSVCVVCVLCVCLCEGPSIKTSFQ